jgi:hypothetical protein
VRSYRTEIVIASDRYVCLQLPEAMPEGRAIVTIIFQGCDGPDENAPADLDPDHQDIEWWEEFEDGPQRVG